MRIAHFIGLLSLAAGCIAIAATGKTPAEPAWHTWSVDDVLTIPQVEQVQLSWDSRSVAYILRIANTQDDAPVYQLHVMGLGDLQDRLLASSHFLDRVQSIPGKNEWSALADFGEGVQLYELRKDGNRTALVVNPNPVLVGNADRAEAIFTRDRPIRFGVAYYDWSPDGRHLFYSLVQAVPEQRQALVNDAVVQASTFRRDRTGVMVRFFMKDENGRVDQITEVSGKDRIARGWGGFPVWGDGWFEYALQIDDKGDPAVQRYRWSLKEKRNEVAPASPPGLARTIRRGPRGGTLTIEGSGPAKRLLERLDNGKTFDYGSANFRFADEVSRSWRAPDGSYSLVPVRIDQGTRYALLRIDREGQTRVIQTAESVRNCSFGSDAATGVCIHDGLAVPPRLVRVSVKSGRTTLLRKISPHHEQIEPLKAQAKTWNNAYGFKATGFVILPRGFRAGTRYPAVLITHGIDADQRFGSPDLQWNYPYQVMAERGYLVVLLNIPAKSQSAMLEEAFETWNSCDGRTSPSEVRRLVWLNTVESMRSALADLAASSLIDPGHVGIAGYSVGSQMTNVAVTQTKLFHAASSGDGDVLEPEGYRFSTCTYNAVFGGPPSAPNAYAAYRSLAPSYRAGHSNTPLLQQVAQPWRGSIDFFLALKAAGVPTELTLYPGETSASDETHVFHIPSNQATAMQENLEWFDFWLRGIEPSAGPDGNRRRRWDALRAAADAARVTEHESRLPMNAPMPRLQQDRAGGEDRWAAG